METITYTVKIEGFSPLVMNSNAFLLLPRGEQDKGRDPAEYEREHFLDKCYRSPDSKGLVIPARCIKKAFVEACKFLPEKPKGVSFKSFAPFIQSAAIFTEDALLDVPIEKVIPLTLVVNLDPSKGSKGPRGPRTRPAIQPPWNAETTIKVFDPILKKDVLQRIADRAGTQVGLLDGRSIDFGRCVITIGGGR
jgi:hypothetical protein